MNPLTDFRFCPHDGQPMVASIPPQEGRTRCPRCGFIDYQNPKPCVNILILRGDRLLLARRKDEPAKGEWDVPGGFVESGETAEEAVIREAFEETTLRVRVVEYIGSVPDVYAWGHWRVPTLNFCYLVEVLSGEPTAQSDVESLAWVPLDALPAKMAFEHQRQVFELLTTRLRARA